MKNSKLITWKIFFIKLTLVSIVIVTLIFNSKINLAHTTTFEKISDNEKIRRTLDKMVRTGRFEKLMDNEKILQSGSIFISFDNIQNIRKILLTKSGFSWKKSSISLKETATALTFDTIAAIQEQRREEYRKADERYNDIVASKKYKELKKRAVKGFETLSNKSVFLDEKGLVKLSTDLIKKKFTDETDYVYDSLIKNASSKIISVANNSKDRFKTYVRYIFFGKKGFGKRDAFLQNVGYQARQKAIKNSLYLIIKEHPEYKDAYFEASYIKSVIAEHAKNLTDVIKDVPTP
jgi:predicted secreted protein